MKKKNYKKLKIKYLLNKDYNADIIFLQECDKDFQENLQLLMTDYTFTFKYKSEHTKQGEAILIRSKRLK